MAYQELKIWAKGEVIDPVKGNPQLSPTREEEWLQGWGRLHGVSTQRLNTMFRTITEYSPPTDYCAYPHLATKTIPDTAIHANGQAITAADQPALFEAFGSNLPDMTADNLTGFIWVFRNH